jgi:hypothetical protein
VTARPTAPPRWRRSAKWGQAVQLTDEKLKRSVYMGDEVNRTLRKTANTVIQKIDKLTTRRSARRSPTPSPRPRRGNAATGAVP